jgi:phenylpropionate dioxygenase-like ring-hydroxylating dioxygenase large terminal subunit
VRVLGENLIGFRTTSGDIGLIADACPHRGASLFFGRNEEEGLRCVYHGWKFDVTGACVDMPSEPAESNFRGKVHARAYPCVERNGAVWAYMGTREVPPPLPDIEPNMRAELGLAVEKVLRDCNWMQGLEGDIDTGHLAFLHLGSISPQTARPKSFDYYTVADKAPRYDVLDTEFGTSYGAYRPAEADTYYWRVAHFLFPFYTMIPTGLLGEQILVRAWVPIDDDHMMFWSFAVPSTLSFGNMIAGQGGVPGEQPKEQSVEPKPVVMGSRMMDFLPDESHWLGKFRLVQNRSNDYGIDREAQSSGESYTGIPGIHQQDQAITESMGTIYERTQEHLGTTDAMVIRTRRRLINAAKALAKDGTIPPGVDDPSVYRYRSGGLILSRSADWLEATKDLRRAFVGHTPEALKAHAAG